MPIRRFGIPLLLTASLGLAACSGVETAAPTFNRCEPGAMCSGVSGQIGTKAFHSSELRSSASDSDDTPGGLNLIFNYNHHAPPQAPGSSVAVNAYLWRGALDTLSFMPLASADPFGGVIITDWYAPPNSPGERFKATVLILGRQLRSNNLRISLSRQVLQDGNWVDAPVRPDMVNDIEDKMLVRARQLRVAAE